MTASSPPDFSGTLLAIQIGQVRPLMVGGRKLVSAIGKTTVSGPIEVGVLGGRKDANHLGVRHVLSVPWQRWYSQACSRSRR